MLGSLSPDLVYFFYEIRLDGLGHPPCFKDLQHLEREGVVPPNLNSFSKKFAYMVTLVGFLSGQEIDL